MGDVRDFPGVPLVGQPLKVRSWVLVVTAECRQCTGDQATSQPYLLQLVSNLACVCPGCGSEHTLRGLTWNHRTGSTDWVIASTPASAERLKVEEAKHQPH